MHLVIDQGNTVCKLAFFDEKDELAGMETCPELSVDILGKVFKTFDIQAAILSSVKTLRQEVTDYIQSNVSPFVWLNHQTPLPIKNAYQTPKTLGLDRIAAAVGAWTLQPDKTLLIVDMGTAVTYDLVTDDGTFIGGNIAPGMRLRLKSLHQQTDRLPLVEPEMDFRMLGEDTQTAIRSGVMQGMVYEIEGYCRDLQQTYPNLFTFLTGGDLFYFDGKLKNSIFACKNLVIIGLNRILHYNVHP